MRVLKYSSSNLLFSIYLFSLSLYFSILSFFSMQNMNVNTMITGFFFSFRILFYIHWLIHICLFILLLLFSYELCVCDIKYIIIRFMLIDEARSTVLEQLNRTIRKLYRTYVSMVEATTILFMTFKFFYFQCFNGFVSSTVY